MAGCPIKRAREAGIRADDGSVSRIVFAIGVKALLDGSLASGAPRERDWQHILASRARACAQQSPPMSQTASEARIYTSGQFRGAGRGDLTVKEAIVASAAAPTYFPPRRPGAETLVDGGITANAPELIGLGLVNVVFGGIDRIASSRSVRRHRLPGGQRLRRVLSVSQAG